MDSISFRFGISDVLKAKHEFIDVILGKTDVSPNTWIEYETQNKLLDYHCLQSVEAWAQNVWKISKLNGDTFIVEVLPSTGRKYNLVKTPHYKYKKTYTVALTKTSEGITISETRQTLIDLFKERVYTFYLYAALSIKTI